MGLLLDEVRNLPHAHGRVGVLWLGQSGFALATEGLTALVDPFLSPRETRRYESALAPEAATGVDALLCTHELVDHFDAKSVPAIARASPEATIVVPAPIVDLVTEAGVPSDRVLGVQPGDAIELGALTVEPVPACHGVTMQDAYGFGESLSGGAIRFLGYVLEVAGVRIYHAGDTIYYDGMVERLRPAGVDVALLPVNGRHAQREARGVIGNLNEREAAWLAAEIGAATLVPMHHDLSRENRGSSAAVVAAAEEEGRRVTVLVPPRETRFVVAGGAR